MRLMVVAREARPVLAIDRLPRALALTCLLLVGIHPCTLFGQEGPDSIEDLRTAIQEELDRIGYGSVGIALVARDETIWTGGFGTADPVTGRPANENSYWRAGSISKSFVSLSALILVERGQLQLADRVAELAPELEIRNRWREDSPIRLVHLLEHSAGFDDLRPKHYASNDSTPLSLRQGLDNIKESLRCRWPPGVHNSYSNAGPPVAAYVIQKVSGQPFEDFVEDEVFRPLGMAGASLLMTERIEAGLVAGYDGNGERVRYSHIVVRPSGALNVTPAQMARYVRMMLNRGELEGRRIVSSGSVDRIERTESTLSAPQLTEFGYGLGNFARNADGFAFRGHNGGMPGYRSEYGYLPEQGLGYCVMASVSTGRLFTRVRDLARRYLTRNLALPAKPEVEEMPADIDRWTGYYRNATPRSEARRYAERVTEVARIVSRQDRLSVSWDGRDIEFLPSGNRTFRRELAPNATLAFVTGPGGSKYVQGEFGNLRKVPGWGVWSEWILVGLVGLLMASALVGAAVWLPLKLAGRLRRFPVTVAAWPLLAVCSLAGAFASLAWIQIRAGTVGGADLLGGPSLAGLASVACSWAFVMLSLIGLARALTVEPGAIGRFARFHAVAVSSACLLAGGYLLYFRAIGFPLWW